MIRRLYLTARTVLGRPDVQTWIGVGLVLVGAERVKRAAMQMMDDLTTLDERIDEKRAWLATVDGQLARAGAHLADGYPAVDDVDPLGRGTRSTSSGYPDNNPDELAGESLEDVVDVDQAVTE